MSNYIKKAAAHARLLKLASAARLIRRQRALQKYAQAVRMHKQALGAGATAGIGAGLGGLIGGGIGYGLGKKDKKLLSTLLGAGLGAGVGGGAGYGLGAYLNKGKATPAADTPPIPGTDEFYSDRLNKRLGGKSVNEVPTDNKALAHYFRTLHPDWSGKQVAEAAKQEILSRVPKDDRREPGTASDQEWDKWTAFENDPNNYGIISAYQDAVASMDHGASPKVAFGSLPDQKTMDYIQWKDPAMYDQILNTFD